MMHQTSMLNKTWSSPYFGTLCKSGYWWGVPSAAWTGGPRVQIWRLCSSCQSDFTCGLSSPDSQHLLSSSHLIESLCFLVEVTIPGHNFVHQELRRLLVYRVVPGKGAFWLLWHYRAVWLNGRKSLRFRKQHFGASFGWLVDLCL